MMDYTLALDALERALSPVAGLETLPLASAAGRLLAEPLPARWDTPAFDNSAMDGYALADPDGVLTDFALAGRTAAGDAPADALLPGEALRIFTGAPLPAGATAVVPQELAHAADGRVRLDAPSPVGSHVRRRAEEFAVGAPLLAAGSVLGPAAIALAASQGYRTVSVRRRLRVAVFSSGNELCEPGGELAPGKIFDANRYQLLAWLASWPVDVVDGGILPDDLAQTRARLAAVAEAVDVILTSGGASVGEEDHLKAALCEIGQLDAWRLAIKPGKPFAWGRTGAAHVFMLPGNPVATFVTFYLLVAPALRKLAGAAAMRPARLAARAVFARGGGEVRREFLRGRLGLNSAGEPEVTPLAGQGSAMLSACAAADCLVEVPPSTAVSAGDWLTVYPLG
ncbi:MAG: molybdopterin molybdotransferase MoeA [Paludibacterium sp.]|uniref:molybdopterin molybdotransferase MoeA n=1 Tax=Paludibacterium sp. TaxID=1917523 RepID=UPI0025D29DB5|nr:gephyrin-like molybdotransferase Glp [Paludibacterium sp.]MBV8047055.1 molybdopterin molybdotransferase MoeA [Paludibacterium sp.]MBV8646413.1 molybdopterin molybdotransferase MoeA [Paludibacterium sp.]